LNREGPIDVLVIAGDLTTKGSAEEATLAIRSFVAAAPCVLVVAGNMDPASLESVFNHLGVGLNGRGVRIGESGFFGVSAAPLSPLHTPNEVTEEELATRAQAGWEEVKDSRWRIFVPHAPPHATRLDRTFTGLHVGSTAVKSFIEKNQPELVICGHIHEARGVEMLGRTTVINCGPVGSESYAVIRLDTSLVLEHSPVPIGRGR
jgi:Icc-related predicted phosphoesterase